MKCRHAGCRCGAGWGNGALQAAAAVLVRPACCFRMCLTRRGVRPVPRLCVKWSDLGTALVGATWSSCWCYFMACWACLMFKGVFRACMNVSRPHPLQKRGVLHNTTRAPQLKSASARPRRHGLGVLAIGSTNGTPGYPARPSS